VRQAALERRIRGLQLRVRTAREELAILVEQIDSLAEDAEDARVRWLVAETPLAEKESADAHRHLELAKRAAATLQAEIDQCVADRDRFLNELPVSARK
jgi:predicted  nucleic acid-binding Zn-ribbon protein